MDGVDIVTRATCPSRSTEKALMLGTLSAGCARGNRAWQPEGQVDHAARLLGPAVGDESQAPQQADGRRISCVDHRGQPGDTKPPVRLVDERTNCLGRVPGPLVQAAEDVADLGLERTAALQQRLADYLLVADVHDGEPQPLSVTGYRLS